MGTKTALSWEEFLAAGKPDQRWEYVEGKVVFMSPTGTRHGRVIHKISEKLAWWESLAAEWVCFGADVVFSMASGEWLCPDAAIVRRARYGSASLPVGPTLFPPDVAFEVISPNDKDDEIQRKRVLYQTNGVLQVWVDPEKRTIEVISPNGAIRLFHEGETAVILPGLGLDISSLLD